jgi:hypothetical protein
MKPIQHPSNNIAFGAQGTVLPVTQTQADGKNVLISFWKPTPEELMSLNTGALIALTVVGEQMPTVSMLAVKA